jgi:hypothetical protein
MGLDIMLQSFKKSGLYRDEQGLMLPCGRGPGEINVSITITPQAKGRLEEVLSNPDNAGSKLRIVFEGFG